MSAGLEATRTRLEHELGEYRSAFGAQMTVVRAGTRVVDLAVGDDGAGRPVTPDSIFRVYCTIKPVLATIVARLVDAGCVDLDAPLDHLLGPLPVLADGMSLRHLLTHTAGLARPMAFEMEVVAPELRRPAIEALSRAPGFALGVDAAYSEFAAWQIVGWAVEAVGDQPLGVTIRAWLDALGMHDTWIGMTPDEHRRVRERVGVSHDLRGTRPFPMALEPGRRWCTEVNPAHGGYTTTRDLARFYAMLLERLRGDGPDALPTAATMRAFCTPAREPVFDPVLDRRCPFGLGFMVPLSAHAFGDAPGPSSFGHSGYAGSSFAFADPDHDLAVAVVFNGIVDHNQAFQRRTDLLRAVYDDLEIVRPEALDPVAT